MIPKWYVVATAPARDYRVRDELVRLGYEVWLPECQVRKITRRAVCSLNGPLFPGYQFVHLERSLYGWRAIEGVRGVEGLLKYQDRPWPLRDDDVERVQRTVDRLGGKVIIEGEAIRREFEPGAAVRIESGPFAGFNGLFVERVSDRCKVVLDLFRRATEMIVSEEQFVPV